jgi:hypothetical protein
MSPQCQKRNRKKRQLCKVDISSVRSNNNDYTCSLFVLYVFVSDVHIPRSDKEFAGGIVEIYTSSHMQVEETDSYKNWFSSFIYQIINVDPVNLEMKLLPLSSITVRHGTLS